MSGDAADASCCTRAVLDARRGLEQKDRQDRTAADPMPGAEPYARDRPSAILCPTPYRRRRNRRDAGQAQGSDQLRTVPLPPPHASPRAIDVGNLTANAALSRTIAVAVAASSPTRQMARWGVGPSITLSVSPGPLSTGLERIVHDVTATEGWTVLVARSRWMADRPTGSRWEPQVSLSGLSRIAGHGHQGSVRCTALMPEARDARLEADRPSLRRWERQQGRRERRSSPTAGATTQPPGTPRPDTDDKPRFSRPD
ncbi:hypothetical protein VTN02DRAFT_6180 [Thermoascus thermophilus]